MTDNEDDQELARLQFEREPKLQEMSREHDWALAKWRVDNEFRMETWRSEREQTLEEWRNNRETIHNLAKYTIDLAGHALKSATLINGGAAIALLAFTAHLVTTSEQYPTVKYWSLEPAMMCFVFGVFLGAVASGLSYTCQYLYSLTADSNWTAQVDHKNAHNDAVVRALRDGNDAPERTKFKEPTPTKLLKYAAYGLHILAIAAVVGCYVTFILGVLSASDAIF